MFRGLGDTKSPLWATLICNGVNVVLDAVFIMYFGWGVRGAAWATIIGQVTSFSPVHTTTLPLKGHAQPYHGTQHAAILQTHTQHYTALCKDTHEL